MRRKLIALAGAGLLAVVAFWGLGRAMNVTVPLPMSEAVDNAAAPDSGTGTAFSREGSFGGTGGTGSDGEPGEAQWSDPDLGPAALPFPEGAGSIPARVIQNVALEVEIEESEFQTQFGRAASLAERFGGFVAGSQVSENDGRLAAGTLTMRVPSERLESMVAALKELGRVTGEDRSGRDVSREFVDLEARLRHAQASEGFFLRLMDEASGVSDLIQVQSQLSAVQLRIEELQGRINYLNDQTSFATVSVRIYEPGAPSGAPPALAEAWQDAVAGFQRVVGAGVVATGYLAPFLLLGMAGLAVHRWRRPPGTKGEGTAAAA